MHQSKGSLSRWDGLHASKLLRNGFERRQARFTLPDAKASQFRVFAGHVSRLKFLWVKTPLNTQKAF